MAFDKKAYMKEYYKKYKLTHKDTRRRDRKDYIREWRFGLTKEDYNKIFEEQNGRCLICLKHQSELKRSLAVDHCHSTNKIRGLLCSSCNPGLGQFKDDEELLFRAVSYLRGDLNDST